MWAVVAGLGAFSVPVDTAGNPLWRWWRSVRGAAPVSPSARSVQVCKAAFSIPETTLAGALILTIYMPAGLVRVRQLPLHDTREAPVAVVAAEAALPSDVSGQVSICRTTVSYCCM